MQQLKELLDRLKLAGVSGWTISTGYAAVRGSESCPAGTCFSPGLLGRFEG